MEFAVQVKQARKTYDMGGNVFDAIKCVDFSVKPGDFMCISGRSGSGKSTLLNLLAGLELPTSGEIILLGEHIEQMSEQERIRFRREHIGFVFQSYNLLPQFSALENVALPLLLQGIAPEKRTKRAEEMLALVGLSSHAEHKPTELSGGQQQRVGIARAIITQPKIVFADEPTGNLDTRTGEEIMNLLTGIFRQWGTTFLLVSHDADMGRHTDWELTMLDGEVFSLKPGNAGRPLITEQTTN